MKFRTIILIALPASIGVAGSAQNLSPKLQVKYDIFNRTPLGQMNVFPPQAFQFEQVPSVSSPQAKGSSSQGIAIPNPQNLIGQSNQQIIQQNNRLYEHDNYRREDQMADIQKHLMEEKLYRDHVEWLNKSKYYRSAFGQLMQLNPDSFSITKAVYIIENAWLENKFSFEIFSERLQFEAKIIRQQLKNEKLNQKDDLALNYGIQKRYRQNIYQYDPNKKVTRLIKPFAYDFEDFQGQKDYSKMFTAKMMVSGKGQCHSMPLIYLMIAEQVGAKAWLSLAPQHSFIKFFDKNGTLLNFETTNGNLVSTNWLLQTGFINANALKSKTYLDTLSQRQLFTQCLSDLLLGYLSKFKYDNFAEQLRQKIASIDSNNMTALILEAKINTQIALQMINAAGRPKEEDLPKFPEAYQAYLNMMAAYDKVDARGYQDMPKEVYQKWLKSIEREKKKQENNELQEKMRREIEMLKKLKTTIIDKPRG